MIRRITIGNYRSLDKATVELGAINVLVGRNGAGKSAFVDSLRFVRDALLRGLDYAIAARHGFLALQHWGPSGRSHPLSIAVETETDRVRGNYSFSIVGKTTGEYSVTHESCFANDIGSGTTEEFEVRNGRCVRASGSPAIEKLLDLRQAEGSLLMSHLWMFSPAMASHRASLSWSSFYSIYPNSLRQPQVPREDQPLLDDAGNLYSVLRRLRKDSEVAATIVAALNKVVETVSDFRVRQVGQYLVCEVEHVTQGKSAWFDLAQESDGTIRMLGILAAIYHDRDRRLVCLEEPELALHPGALAVLADVLNECATTSQTLVTTQSPDLISRFHVDDIRVVERVEGDTLIGPLSLPQVSAVRDHLFSIGDLLRIEGLHRRDDQSELPVHA